MPKPLSTMMYVNLLLGTAVVTVGFWLLWGTAASGMVAPYAVAAGGFLWWKAKSMTEVWAWSTLLLGLESFAWPVLLMVQLRSASTTPSEDEMGTVLSAVVLGLFASVFWISFSYGLFKRAWDAGPGSHARPAQEYPMTPEPAKSKKKR